MTFAKGMLWGVPALLLSAQVMAQVTFYEGEDFHGRAFTTTRAQPDLSRDGFNDRASSVIVDGGRWEVCDDGNYGGDCVLLRPGTYGSLRQLGLDNRVSSARRVSDQDSAKYADYYSPEPGAAATYEYRRRPNERVYQARVTSVRGVMDSPAQRCWIEPAQVSGGTLAAETPAAIGGVLGHQTGRVSGQFVALGETQQRDRAAAGRCETTDPIPPDYWDVTYTFRDVTHHVQLSELPGPTIYVNAQGEPRQ
jgi:hypothetical protein